MTLEWNNVLKLADLKTNAVFPKKKLSEALTQLKDKQYFPTLYQKNLEKTKHDLKKSVTEDQLIIQATANINELDKTGNLLTKRLREWYSWHYPELSEEVKSNEKYAQLVLEPRKHSSFGADLDKTHLEEMRELAKEITKIYELRQKHEQYLENVLKKYAPNLLELAGTTIAAKLIEQGKSLKHLAMLPASTIQLLGAEKALFRHIKTGSRGPKYGIIFQHQLIQNTARQNKGKAARALADRLSLSARLDFFKGEFKADKYKQELEKKFL